MVVVAVKNPNEPGGFCKQVASAATAQIDKRENRFRD